MKEVTMTNGSVEWFLDQLIEHRIIIVNRTTYQVKYKHEILMEQAKEMEKEQIIQAFNQGVIAEFTHQVTGAPETSGQEYFNQTYGDGVQ
jgi:prephenate dehydratase